MPKTPPVESDAKPEKKKTRREEILDRLADECIAEMLSSSGPARGFGWCIDNGTLRGLDTNPIETPAELKHDSTDGRTTAYAEFRKYIRRILETEFNVRWNDTKYDENELLLQALDQLGELKTDGIMNFQLVRAPHSMRQEITDNLCEGRQMRDIDIPSCAPDRGVSKDLVSRLVGHTNEITTVGILYDNATSKPAKEDIDETFFPADEIEFDSTGFAIGIKTQNVVSCICIRGYTYDLEGQRYRTYKGIIIERIIDRKIQNVLYFNGVRGDKEYLEPTVEKLAADECYNNGPTGLTPITRIVIKQGGDYSQRVLAGLAAEKDTKITITTGDGNMFCFALNGIKFKGIDEPKRFPIVYAKMRTLIHRDEDVTYQRGPLSLIISTWPDQGTLSDTQVKINQDIKSKRRRLVESEEESKRIIQNIQEIDEFSQTLQITLEQNRRITPKISGPIIESFNRIKNMLETDYNIGIPGISISKNFEAESPITQIYNILFKMNEDGSTRFAEIKQKLELRLSDTQVRKDLIEQEIDEMKMLFDSYIEGETDDLESIASSSAPPTPSRMGFEQYPGPFYREDDSQNPYSQYSYIQNDSQPEHMEVVVPGSVFSFPSYPKDPNIDPKTGKPYKGGKTKKNKRMKHKKSIKKTNMKSKRRTQKSHHK